MPEIRKLAKAKLDDLVVLHHSETPESRILEFCSRLNSIQPTILNVFLDFKDNKSLV